MKVFAFFIVFISLKSWSLSESSPATEKAFESVVLFTTTTFDPQLNEQVEGACNGNLLSSKVMITAAHCVYMADILNQKQIGIQTGKYLYTTRKNEKRRRLGYSLNQKQTVKADIFLTKKLRKKLIFFGPKLKIGGAEDIAVLVFDRDLVLPDDFRYSSILPQKNLEEVIASFPTNMPYVVSTNFTSEVSTADAKRFAQLESITQSWRGYFSSDSMARVAPGDSGAPLLIFTNGSFKQIGVTKGKAANLISNWDVYGILDDKLCEIANEAANPEISNLLCPQ